MNADQRLPLNRMSGAGAKVGDSLVWNGTAWVPGTSTGLVIVSPTAPSSPATGQLWYDNDTSSGSQTNVMLTMDHATYNPSLSSIVYDGNRAYASWAGMGFGTINPVIDLGAAIYIGRVNWLLYYGDTRTYSNVGLEGSLNNSTWTSLRTPATYQPSLDGATGLDITVNDTYRYLRFHCDGNSVNTNNEWVEVEVWAVARFLLKLWDGTAWVTVSSG